VPLIDTDPEADVIFTVPITLNVAPPAMLIEEEAKKEVWPFRASVQALEKEREEARKEVWPCNARKQAPEKEKEDPRHTSRVATVYVPPEIKAVGVKRETEGEIVTADEVEA
jgi:hypothetical protein